MSFTFKRGVGDKISGGSSGKKMSPQILGRGRKCTYLKNIYPWPLCNTNCITQCRLASKLHYFLRHSVLFQILLLCIIKHFLYLQVQSCPHLPMVTRVSQHSSKQCQPTEYTQLVENESFILTLVLNEI